MQNQVENIANLIRQIEDIQMRYDFLNAEIVKINAKQQDLLHEIENGKFNTVQGYFKLMEIKEVRQYRRELKNEIEIILPYFQWYKQHEKLVLDLHKIKGSMAKIAEHKENWKYTSREKGEVVGGAV